jgi:hypothetical protein
MQSIALLSISNTGKVFAFSRKEPTSYIREYAFGASKGIPREPRARQKASADISTSHFASFPTRFFWTRSCTALDMLIVACNNVQLAADRSRTGVVHLMYMPINCRMLRGLVHAYKKTIRQNATCVVHSSHHIPEVVDQASQLFHKGLGPHWTVVPTTWTGTPVKETTSSRNPAAQLLGRSSQSCRGT